MPSSRSHNPPPQVKLYSINIKGRNTPQKRSRLLLLLWKAKADVVFIQETHFKSDNIPKLTNSAYPTVYHATNLDSKSKGVSILISKNCPLQIQDTMIDPNARYISLKGKLHNIPITLANLYALNKQHVPFLRDTL